MSDAPDAPDRHEDDALEQALRARLHAVDDLDPPPAPDFAVRAIAAARERSADRRDTDATRATGDTRETGGRPLAPVVPLHRRPWARTLTGVAAALVLGTAALTGLQHVGGGSSASSGAAAQPEAGGAQGAASQQPVPLDASGGSGAATAGGGVLRAALLGRGSATGPTTTSLPDAVARLQQRLREPPYFDLRPTVAQDGGTVVVTLQVSVDRRPDLDPALVDLVSRSLPAGTPVEYRAP